MWSACGVAGSEEKKAVRSRSAEGHPDSPAEAHARFHRLLKQLGQEYDQLASQLGAGPCKWPPSSPLCPPSGAPSGSLAAALATTPVSAPTVPATSPPAATTISLEDIVTSTATDTASESQPPPVCEEIPTEDGPAALGQALAIGSKTRQVPRSAGGGGGGAAKPKEKQTLSMPPGSVAARRARNVKLARQGAPGAGEAGAEPPLRSSRRSEPPCMATIDSETMLPDSLDSDMARPIGRASWSSGAGAEDLRSSIIRKRAQSALVGGGNYRASGRTSVLGPKRMTIHEVETTTMSSGRLTSGIHEPLFDHKPEESSSQGDVVATGSATPGRHAQLPDWFKLSHQEGATNFSGEELECRMADWLEKEQESLQPPRASGCVCSPVSRRRLAWDAVWCLLLLYELWLTPIQLFFLDDSVELPVPMQNFSWFVIAYFFGDIVLNFFTGYVDLENQMLIMSQPLVIQNYIKGWFFFDLAATMPWDQMTGSGTLLSPMRAAKATKMSKALRVIKILKLLRVIKVVRTVRNVKFMYDQKPIEDLQAETREGRVGRAQTWLREKVSQLHGIGAEFSTPLKILLSLVLMSHLFASLLAAATPEQFTFFTMGGALLGYYRSFVWAFSLLTFGEIADLAPASDAVWALCMWGYFVRVGLASWGVHQIICQALAWKEQEAKSSMDHKRVMSYLKKHGVSAETQLSVLQIIRSGIETRQEYLSFQRTLPQIPEEVHRTISQEIWVAKLMTLGIIREVCAWDDRFVLELAQVAREELYAPKVTIFKHGDLATAAYHVISGVISIMSLMSPNAIPPFPAGSWIGEKCLISAGLRRSGVAYTRAACVLMAVPAHGFALLLESYGLKSRFDTFCSTQLWRGLCGRCGLLGDHFSDECPILSDEGQGWSWLTFLKGAQTGPVGRVSTASSIGSAKLNDKAIHLARDLKMFLKRQHLTMLETPLANGGITTLEALHELPVEELRIIVADCGIEPLTSDEEIKVSAEAIVEFLADAASEFKNALGDEEGTYFLFLSHYKVEAGTEAALMRNELEGIMQERDPTATIRIFLDSEDLTTLEALQDKVRNSDNLALLLTPGVLTRPWVLVELATARQVGVPVHPVQLTKPGCEFTFPDDAFYESVRDGSVVGEVGAKVIRDCGFEMEEVCLALQSVFKTITCPYSPHRPATIRRAELFGLLQHCVARGPGVPGVGAYRPGSPGGYLKNSVGDGTSSTASGAGVAGMGMGHTASMNQNKTLPLSRSRDLRNLTPKSGESQPANRRTVSAGSSSDMGFTSSLMFPS